VYQTVLIHAKTIAHPAVSPVNGNHEGLNIGAVIRELREQQGKRAVDLAKTAGIGPRTFTASEKNRIKNPSLLNLQTIAKALNVSTADFFSLAESGLKENIHQGGQKGKFSFEFTGEGFKLISYAPMVPEFFIGKVMMASNVKIEADSLPVKGYIFVQVIFGRLTVFVNQREFLLKEGEHFLLNSRLPHVFLNSLLRESSFSLLTVPSFLNAF
jgi:transcriptional regulator with XRE-family HTH domain